MDDLVSIILPCYKAEKYINNIINDVLNQTYSNWELIAISNGDAQSAQLQILNQYKGGKIKVFSLEKGNVCLARNTGIQNFTGKWLMFVDADDRISPSHLQTFMDAAADSPDIIVAGYKQYRVIDKTEKVLKIEKHTPADTNIKRYICASLDGPINIVWNKMFSASFIKESGIMFNENYTCMEDAVFVLQLCLKTNRIATIPLCGYTYMINPEQSATSRYHSCREEVSRKRIDLMNELMRQAGFSETEIAKYRESRLSKIGNGLTINMFRIGSNLSFKEKIKEIRRIAFNDLEVRKAIKSCNSCGGDTYNKIFRLLYRADSPVLIAIAYSIMFSLRYNFSTFYNKMRK